MLKNRKYGRKACMRKRKISSTNFWGGVEVCLGLKYDTDREAHNASVALKRHCQKVAIQPVEFYCRRNVVYVTKEE